MYFCFWEDRVDIISLFSLLNTILKPWMLYIKQHETLVIGETNADPQETWGEEKREW